MLAGENFTNYLPTAGTKDTNLLGLKDLPACPQAGKTFLTTDYTDFHGLKKFGG